MNVIWQLLPDTQQCIKLNKLGYQPVADIYTNDMYQRNEGNGGGWTYKVNLFAHVVRNHGRQHNLQAINSLIGN